MGHDRTVSFTLDTNLVMIKENPEGHPSCTIAGRWCVGRGVGDGWGGARQRGGGDGAGMTAAGGRREGRVGWKELLADVAQRAPAIIPAL